MVSRAPEQLFFKEDHCVPNSRLPVLVYRGISFENTDTAAEFERVFTQNHWPAQWRDGIFDYHHYHSNAHEVLGVAKGAARVKLGGESGQEVNVGPGDVLVLPAGTGHCCVDRSDDFLVVGAYPASQENYDTRRADPQALAASKRRISQVPLPLGDPLSGPGGALSRLWT
jgi:uncharacterized protein YjlB